MIRSNGNYPNISNRNFAQMLEEINLNLQSFPLTSLNNGSSSQNAALQGGSNGIVGHSNSNLIQASLLHGNSEQQSSLSSQQEGNLGGYHLRYQLPSNVSSMNNRFESTHNNYARNRENNSLHGGNENGASYNNNNNPSQNNTRKKQGSSPKIQDILTCFICLGKLKNAHMCPDCQKMCCESCIKEWLCNKSQCPHCRSHLRPSKLMKCRFVSEITTALEKIEQIEQRKEKQGICEEHDNPLQYYCQQCKHPVCSDCGMIGSKHKNHKFEKLNNVYDAHVNSVKKELDLVQKKLQELHKQQQEVDLVIEKITLQRHNKADSLEQQMECVNIKLNDLLKSKLDKLAFIRGPIQEEIDLLKGMNHEINEHIETLPKSLLISQSSDIIKNLQEINTRGVLQNYISENDKKLEFYYDMIPSYDSADFFLQNYSVKRRSPDVAYSETLKAHGNEWRLKVYLNGKDKSKDTYLSVFVEMTKGCVKPSNFEYRVEMINQRNSELRVTREFVSPFETGATWGYERFFKLDQLESEGYLLPESDMLILKYYVRSPSYSQFCNSKQNKIEELEHKNQQLHEEIKHLRENQHPNQSKQYHQEDLNNPQQESELQKYEGINESKADNFELETFINEIDTGNLINIRSEFETYLMKKNLEEFENSDPEGDYEKEEECDDDIEHNQDKDDEDDDEDDNNDDEEGNEEDEVNNNNNDDDDDERNCNDDDEDEDNNDGSEDNYQDYASEGYQEDDRENQDDGFTYENEENAYEYKRQGINKNGNKEKQIIDKIIKGDEFQNEYNDQIEFNEIHDHDEDINLKRNKLSKKEEIQLRDQQYLNDELELNHISKEIQDILKQETDLASYRLQLESQNERNKFDDLDELDLYCKMEEESGLELQNHEYINQEVAFKSRDQQIQDILSNNIPKISDTTSSIDDINQNRQQFSMQQQQGQQQQQQQQQPKECDYRLRWNGIMQNVSQAIKRDGTTKTTLNQPKEQTHLFDTNSNHDNLFDEKISMELNDLKKSVITQENGFPDMYMCLDEIGDKVQFVPLSQQENNHHLSDSSIIVKKNLLPEFEQEALRLEDKYKFSKNDKEKEFANQKNDRLLLQQSNQNNHQISTKARQLGALSSTNTPSNQTGLQKAPFSEYSVASINQDNQKNKQQMCEEQSFQSTKTSHQTQEQANTNNKNNIKINKESGFEVNNQKYESLFSSKYEHQNSQKNEIERIKSTGVFKQHRLMTESQATKNNESGINNQKIEGFNNLKSDRLYTYSVNTNNGDGKDSLTLETHSYKQSSRNNQDDGESIVKELKDQLAGGGVSNSTYSQPITQQIKTNRDDRIGLGVFSNPTLSKLVASHSQQKENKEDSKGQSQIKVSTTVLSAAQNNKDSLSSDTSKRMQLNQHKIEKHEQLNDGKYEGDGEYEDILEKENKDDSLLSMENQCKQKLETINNKQEEQLGSQSQDRILQQKESPFQQQQWNIPSQQNLIEARKQLISSINFPEDFLKKVNKVKSYGTANQQSTSSILKNQQDNHQSQSSSNSSANADPANQMQNDKSQKKNTLLKLSTLELGLNQMKIAKQPSATNFSIKQEINQQSSTSPNSQNSNNMNNKMNQSLNTSENSDIKKQEEEIKKLEDLVGVKCEIKLEKE